MSADGKSAIAGAVREHRGHLLHAAASVFGYDVATATSVRSLQQQGAQAWRAFVLRQLPVPVCSALIINTELPLLDITITLTSGGIVIGHRNIGAPTHASVTNDTISVHAPQSVIVTLCMYSRTAADTLFAQISSLYIIS
jgi:hypothetical protein